MCAIAYILFFLKIYMYCVTWKGLKLAWGGRKKGGEEGEVIKREEEGDKREKGMNGRRRGRRSGKQIGKRGRGRGREREEEMKERKRGREGEEAKREREGKRKERNKWRGMRIGREYEIFPKLETHLQNPHPISHPQNPNPILI